MEDNKQTTTEQPEVKGHVLTAEEVTDWGNKSVIVEPGVKDERGNEVKQGVQTAETEEEEPEKPTTDTIQEEYEEPEPVVTAEDPGVYEPKDYSFEVTIYDEDGKNGKSVKIKSVDDFEELLDKDVNFGTSSALLKAQRLATKMESNSERDHAEWQKKMDAYTEQIESARERNTQISTIAAEITYLVNQGKLPAADKKYADADWSDPEVAKQPGVKEQIELLNYMRKENNARQKAGLQPFSSALDAYNAMQLESRDKKVAEVQKQAGESRREAGSRIAGNTPAPVTVAPKGVSVGRGGNLRDLDPGW